MVNSIESDLEQVFKTCQLLDFKWIDPQAISVRQWVRFKCTWGCRNYGARATCPPNVPSTKDCRAFFKEYKRAVLFHFRDAKTTREERYAWTGEINRRLLELERAVFLRGYYKAFVLYVDTCRICEECTTTRDACKQKMASRPAPDALGVDVYQIARNAGYTIEVLTDPTQAMDRFGFLLLD
ncbi:MAG: hypothetical protein RBG13Loki_4167 [Promethearchaeota archaeon CR_4]|nr:MAG: hypothetical protein RBG13Loki_4167 [Candidatus Lokiarchaeota archaeon CR_4]